MNKTEEIYNKLKERNCTLLDDLDNVKIINSTKLKIKEKNTGFVGYITYKNLKGDKKISFFAKCNPYTIDNIKTFLENNTNLILKSDTYNGSDKYLIVECLIHGEYKSTWDNLKQGYGCMKCSVDKRAYEKRTEYTKVKEDFARKGYRLLTNEYMNKDVYMTAVNEEGYKISVPYSAIKYTSNDSCNLFFIKSNPFVIDNIRLYLSKNYDNFDILEETYENAHTNMKFYCKKHKETIYATWNNISKGKACHLCWIEKHSGENNNNYNPNLTQEERELKRAFLGKERYDNWRLSVFKRDNFKCVITNKNGKLNAHHLNGWMWDKENRLNIDNGVTLCDDIHKEFHKTYGYKNNTVEQFIEFYKLKTGKDFQTNMAIPN